MTNQATLFDTEATARITVNHIHALWRRHGCFAQDAPDTIRKATDLANAGDHLAAANLIADHDPHVISEENGLPAGKPRAEVVEHLVEALTDPASISMLYPEPTLADCQRHADLTTESGRCIAWLLNQWPRECRIPQPPPLGDRDVDMPRTTALHIGATSVDLVRTITVHPWAEKESVQITGVTADQLLAAGRWFIGNAANKTVT